MAGVRFFYKNSGFTWCLHVLSLCAIISQIGCLSILEHTVDPPVVSNCSSAILTCRVEPGAPNVEVWWTFRGENASKLPDTTILTDKADEGEWRLELKCPTLEHKGSYACNAQGKNESEIVYRKEALLRIFVPVTMELERRVTAQLVRGKVNLTCIITAHPVSMVEWFKDGELINTTDARLQVDVQEIASVTSLASLYIEDLQREDNGTYMCQAINEFTNATAVQDLLVEEPPEVEFLKDQITVENASTVTLRWHVLYDGNLPVGRFRLEKNPGISSDDIGTDIDHDILGNITEYTVENLLPGFSYTFRISSSNAAGDSNYDSLNVSMPADVPPKVSWVHVLGSTNETLLFGWRRPNHDNGANITHYTVKLHSFHNGSLVANNTMEIIAPGRNNHMYIFVNLEPGETYTFQVQACNALGCGLWSEPQEGTTSDGDYIISRIIVNMTNKTKS